MSTDDELDLDDLNADDPDLVSKLRKLNRQQAKQLKEADQARAEVDELRRERAFLRAGIDLDKPVSRYFVKAYDGDLDPDAIREAAIEAGILGAPNTEEIEAALDGAQRAQQAASGGRPPSGDSELRVLKNMQAAKRQIKSNDELAAFLQSHGIGEQDIADYVAAGGPRRSML
jgi:hypothetical protein